MDQVSKIYLCATATVCHFIIAAPAHVSETQGLCYSTSSSRKPQKAPAPRTVAAHYRSREGKGSADMETVCFPHEAAPKKLIRSSARARSRESVTPSACMQILHPTTKATRPMIARASVCTYYAP